MIGQLQAAPFRLAVANLVRRARADRRVTSSEPLPTKQQKVVRIEDEIATPKPSRLRLQSEEPFQPPLLHARRRLWKRSRDERERRTYRQQRHGKQGPHLIREDLLPRATKANHRDRRTGLTDALSQCSSLVPIQGPELRWLG